MKCKKVTVIHNGEFGIEIFPENDRDQALLKQISNDENLWHGYSSTNGKFESLIVILKKRSDNYAGSQKKTT